MRKIEEIKEQIRNLSGTELVKFRKWSAEFDAQVWGDSSRPTLTLENWLHSAKSRVRLDVDNEPL